MKHFYKRFSAATLALSLMMGQAALASDALGWDLHFDTRTLSEGATLTTGQFWSDTYSDLRTERYVSYTPNAYVKPAVAYGSTVLKKGTLSTMARQLENSGKRVVGGTNGDFYVLKSGQPLGLVVTDGVVRSSSSYHYAIGFRSDGTAFIGQPGLQVSAIMPKRTEVEVPVDQTEGETQSLPEGEEPAEAAPATQIQVIETRERVAVTGGINKIREVQSADGGGLLLLTEDFAATTENSAAGVDVFLHPMTDDLGQVIPAAETGLGQDLTVTDKPRIGGRVRCVVDYVTQAAKSNPIPAGGFVLTMNKKDNADTIAWLSSLQSGDVVELDVTCADTRWNEAVEAMGGMYRLLDNGAYGSNLSTERTARTAIGVKSDGTVIFYTLDGKQAGLSVGATCKQVAQRLKELGCVDAIGLDGGGSTTIGVTYPDKNAMEVVNSPSDGGQRSVTNAIFLTTDLKATGVPHALDLKPNSAVVLTGAQVGFGASMLDSHWYDMGLTPATFTATGAGTVSAEGLFTAGSAAGEAIVTADAGDGVTGTANITVVDTPTSITVTNENTGAAVRAISLEPNEQISLTASAVWKGLPLISRDESYTWTCDPGIGAISADGTFTAGPDRGKGNLAVTAGGKSVTIPVNVAGHIYVLDDMEGNTPFVADGNAQLTMETTLNNVRTGRQSMKVSYDGGEARLTGWLSIAGSERYLGAWVYGDGSGNSLAAWAGTAEGDVAFALTTLDFTGWKHVLAPLPQGTNALTGLTISGGKAVSGVIWLDQLTTSNEAVEDFNAPTVEVKVSGSKLTATVSDDIDRTIPESRVKLFYDGKEIKGSWNSTSLTLTATLSTGDGKAHRVSVQAMDASGNIGRDAKDVGSGGENPFADMENHWARSSALYLYEHGVTNGVSAGDELFFRPDADITRAEFFTMVARWLGLDLDAYGDVTLPFADTKTIPSWALSAVRAMYAEGIVTGSLERDGLYAHAGNTITRCEAMAILGRTQERGYPQAELSGFTDGATVPAWAAGYVGSLVGQGAVNGFDDGSLRPSASMSRAQVAKVLCSLR